MSEYIDFLHEVFYEFGSISTRKMFVGHGVYHQCLMFGLVADDELYLKADNENVQHFMNAGLNEFEYEKQGKKYKMSYYQAPEEIYDDPEIANRWAALAYSAALRASDKKMKKQSKSKRV